jgi:Spy/CpxP family protein refolding chaperone
MEFSMHQFFLISVLLLTSCASPDAGKKTDKKEPRRNMARELELTDAQLGQLSAIRSKYRPAMKSAGEREKLAIEALDLSLLDAKTTRDDFRKSFMALKEAQAEKNQTGLDFLWEVRSILSQEQRLKWKQRNPLKSIDE